MSSKRPGWRSAQRTHNFLTRDLQNKAAREAAENRYGKALRLCLTEIEQFHSHAYPECDGFCPAHEAMGAARKALSISSPSPFERSAP